MSTHPLLPRPTVAFIPARPYYLGARWLEDAGHDRETVLAEAGIDPEVIAHSEGVLTLEQIEAFTLAASRFVGPRATEFGAGLLFPAYGELGFAALTAPTIEHALAVAERYLEIVSPLFMLHYSLTAVRLRIELWPVYRMDRRVFLIHIKMILSTLHALAINAVGKLPDGLQIATPVEDSELRTWLRGLNAQRSRSIDNVIVWLPSRVAKSRMPLADARAHAGFVKQCQRQVSHRPLQDSNVRAVRRALRDAGPPFPNIKGISRQLGASARTVRRHLKQEGASYQELLSEARFTWAARQLAYTHRPITTLAYDLGYSTPASFTRAFGQALGTSPTEYRVQAQQDAFGEVTAATFSAAQDH